MRSLNGVLARDRDSGVPLAQSRGETPSRSTECGIVATGACVPASRAEAMCNERVQCSCGIQAVSKKGDKPGCWAKMSFVKGRSEKMKQEVESKLSIKYTSQAREAVITTV